MKGIIRKAGFFVGCHFLFLVALRAQIFQSGRLKPLLESKHDSSYFFNPERHDSLFSANVPSTAPKHFTRAAGTLLLTEAVPLVYDRYIANKDYARISFRTIGSHFKLSAWSFDDDGFIENQFGHPYHGNLFFNTFRNNGYSYWQSVPASFIGSYLWETIAENQAPSPNDLINTTLGGITLGEMTYRIAHKILNPRKKGLVRQSREIFATMLNPVMGFTRATSGQWGKVADGADYTDPARLFSTIDVGVRRFDTRSNDILERGKNDIFGRISLLYVDSTASLKTPFREFFVRAEIGHDDSAFINNLSVYGSLAAWDIGGNENTIQRVMVTANYDMYHNAAFYYGAQGFNATWQTHYYLPHSDLTGIIGIGAVALAAIPNQYLHYGAFRRYDYASGGSAVANVSYAYQNRWYANLVYRGSLVRTINGLQDTHYTLNNYAVDAGYRFWKNLSLHVEYARLTLHGYYRDYPDDIRRYPMGRLFLRYALF